MQSPVAGTRLIPDWERVVFCVIFRVIRLPPWSPLFPYTTLFRSGEIDRLWNDPAHSLFVSRLSVLEMMAVFAGKVRDRKSTRLNSSHSQTSYAVFCLKKKKAECDQEPHRAQGAANAKPCGRDKANPRLGTRRVLRYFSSDTSPTLVSTLSLHDALPIWGDRPPLERSGPQPVRVPPLRPRDDGRIRGQGARSEEHTSELQSQSNLVCRLLLEKKKSRMRPRTPPSARSGQCKALWPGQG